MRGFHFRQGVPADGPDLLRVHTEAIAAISPEIYAEDIKASWAHGLSPEGYGRSMERGEDFEVAIDAQGRLVGFCGVQDGEAFSLFIHPSVQSAGLGRRLLANGEKRASLQRPDAPIWLLSASLNAVAFYIRNGYRLVRVEDRSTRGGMIMQVALMEKPRSP